MRVLFLLAALSAASVSSADDLAKPIHGLQWGIQLEKVFSNFNAIPLRASLYNITGKSLRFETKDKRPRLEFLLTPAGGKAPDAKPLPKDAPAYRSGPVLRRMAHAWLVIADLRKVYGPLAPGKYSVQVRLAPQGWSVNVPGFAPKAILSKPVVFEVVKTTLADAQKANPKAAGIELVLAKGKGKKDPTVVVTNRGKRTLVFWAFVGSPGTPLQSVVEVQSWSGRSWSGALGALKCGTGLSQIKLPPGASRTLHAAPLAAGIHRFAFRCTAEGAPKKTIVAVSDAILIKD